MSKHIGRIARSDKFRWVRCPNCGGWALTDGKIITCGGCLTTAKVKEAKQE